MTPDRALSAAPDVSAGAPAPRAGAGPRSTPPAPATLPDALVRELTAVVGSSAVITDPDRLLVYESDGLVHHRGRPSAVVLPADTREAAAVVALLHRADVTVVPRGAGTGLSGGAVPSDGAVVLGTARMNRILSLEPGRRRARLQAGVVNAELSQAARPHDLHYAPDPSSQTACTIGGNVAENSGGPHCLKYGVTARYVTGLTVVTPTGAVVELDGDEARHAGIVGAFVGSEGCFGLVTEVEVRLVPPAPHVRTLLAAFPSLASAGAAVSALIARGMLPAALEILDRHTIRAVEESVFAAGYPRSAGAVLVAEFDGPGAVLDADAPVAREIFEEHGAVEVREARDEAERAALWKGRKKAFGAMGRLAPDLLVQDATVPRSRLPEVLAAIDGVAERHDLRVANVFHAGDGNLHPNLVFDRRDPDQVARVERASLEIMELCVAAGGTITGEHGVGLDKRGYMGLVHAPHELELQRAVRRVFDPDGRWNPGKVLPDEGATTEAPSMPGAARHRTPRAAPSGTHPSGVVEYEPADLVITVSAEIAVGELQAVAAAAGQWFPLEAAGVDDLTLAELVDEGCESTLAGSHGSLRDLILGLGLRPVSGPAIQLGGRVVKNVAGLPLLPLVVGHRGRLGRVEQLTLRLWPLPEVDRSLVVAASRPEELAALADEVAALRLPADAVELVWSPRGAELAVRVLGSRPRVEALLAPVSDVVAGAGWTPVVEEGRRSRIPALPGRRGQRRQGGFTGRASDAVGAVRAAAGDAGPRWLQVDQGVCGVPGRAEAPSDAASPEIRRWWREIENAFATVGAGPR